MGDNWKEYKSFKVNSRLTAAYYELVGGIIRDLSREKGIEMHEGHAMPDTQTSQSSDFGRRLLQGVICTFTSFILSSSH